MRVDFKDYITNHCKYCVNEQTEECKRCSSENGYISYPSGFVAVKVIEQEYFRLLADYSKMLHNMGFEIIQ